MNTGKLWSGLLVLVLGVGAVGCETHTGNAALLGGAGGALAGAAIGSHSHGRAGPGALVGGAIGAIGGAIVGNEMDRHDRGYRYADYDRGGRYYDDGPDYYRYERRTYHPHYRRSVRYYDDRPPGRYEYRGYRRGGHGRYYESTHYSYR